MMGSAGGFGGALWFSATLKPLDARLLVLFDFPSITCLRYLSSRVLLCLNLLASVSCCCRAILLSISCESA